MRDMAIIEVQVTTGGRRGLASPMATSIAAHQRIMNGQWALIIEITRREIGDDLQSVLGMKERGYKS